MAKNGGHSILVDLAHSTLNDLGRPSRWKDVKRLAALATIVGIDIPCNTWSRARRAPWWSKMPSPLRHPTKGIWGLHGLSLHDLRKVRAANHMVRQAASLIRWCLKHNVCGYLENPWTSMIWLTPPLQRLLRLPCVFLIRADMCQYQYHTQWKKPTGLLIWGCHPFELKTCWHGTKC